MTRRARLVAVLFAMIAVLSVRCGSAPETPAGKTDVRDADVARVRALFEGRKFAELTALLEEYQTACDRDIRYEYAAQNGFLALSDPAPSRKALFDEWIGACPDSWVPLTARATWHEAAGWKARGTKWAQETTDDQFREMTDRFELAMRDLDASLRLRPRQLYAYVILMDMAKSFGDREKGDLLAGKALELYPDSYILRRRHILALLPRWGGSYRAMDAFARESAPYAAKNALIGTLRGCSSWDRADEAARYKDFPRAIKQYNKALSYGENWNVLYDLAECYYRAKMYDDARRTVDRAIALHPVWASGYGLRSSISFMQKDVDAALRDIETMERPEFLEADDAPVIRKWQGARLVSEGHALSGTDFPGAAGRYTQALRFDPKNADAYLGRAGAYLRMGDAARGIEDLNRACGMGNTQACERLKSLPGGPRP